MTLELGSLGFDRGAHLLLDRALRRSAVVQVEGSAAELDLHLSVWCRTRGHRLEGRTVHRGAVDRWVGSEVAGELAQPAGHPPARWGLAPRGARVEAGDLGFHFQFTDRNEVWTDEAARLYQAAAAAQWNPETAIDWDAPMDHPEEVEDAVVQVMTYLIENEMAALQVPARFLARIHPHFREVLQVLAIQVADEARHIEVFTRRASLRRSALGLSTQGGQASLKTLLDEPDFALSAFLLSVLGEGSFLELLWFLQEHGPDPVTRQVARLAAKDEARHVAFGMAHLSAHARSDPSLLGRLASAVQQRHAALQHTAGLNQEVFDALVLLSAGGWSPEQIETGWARVAVLKQRMDRGRRIRLARLGFADEDAATLSALHTRNFM